MLQKVTTFFSQGQERNEVTQGTEISDNLFEMPLIPFIS